MIERLLALAVLAASGVYLVNGLPLSLGTAARPGPGFYPLSIGTFGAAVALVWVVSAFRRAPAAASGVTAPGAGRGRVATTAGLLVAYCLLFPWTGYPLAAFGFTGLLLRGLGAGWPAALVIGLVSSVGSYYLFGVLLGVPLPRGVL
jgi:putative tricarboxylic transport membrane protein